MRIEALKLTLSDGDINGLLEKHLRDSGPVEELRVRLTPEGVMVQGQYPALFMKVSFEMLWELSAAGAEVWARLASVTVGGLPAGMLRGVLLKVFRDSAEEQPGVEVGDESIRIHVEQFLRARGVPVQFHFTALRCGSGSLTLEAG